LCFLNDLLKTKNNNLGRIIKSGSNKNKQPNIPGIIRYTFQKRIEMMMLIAATYIAGILKDGKIVSNSTLVK
jgi:hypothetical protein